MKVILGAIVVLTLMIGAPLMYAPSDSYKKGYSEGVRDGHNMIFHQAKLIDYDGVHHTFGQGYVDGWRSTCKEMGLDTGPDSGCELSMD